MCVDNPSQVSLEYKEILAKNGIKEEISDVIVTHPSMQGDAMCSQSQYVTIKFQNTDIKPINLFVKTVASNPVHFELIQNCKLFEKEAKFYLEYLPAARELCESKGLESLMNIYPKCYYGDDKTIVFENLVVEKGYKLLDKVDQQDMDNVKLAIPTIAKHHAISYAMIQELGGAQKFFERFTDLDYEGFTNDYFGQVVRPLIENGVVNSIKILQQNTVKGRDNAIATLKETVGTEYELCKKALECSPEDVKVLNHGDYWNNNMMFLHNEKNEIVRQMIIDFQLTRYTSPVSDICYYLYTSVKPEVRRDNLDEILKLYLENFLETTKSFGHHIEMSYEDLLLVYRKKFAFGYWFSQCVSGGAGLYALKGLDLKNLQDLSDWPKQYNILINDWIDENPDKGEEMANSIVQCVEEYNKLMKSLK